MMVEWRASSIVQIHTIYIGKKNAWIFFFRYGDSIIPWISVLRIPFLHQLYKFKWIPGSKSYKIMIWSTDNPRVEMIRHIINVKKSNSPQCPTVLHDPKLKKSFTWRGNLRSVFHPLIFSIFFWSGSTLSRVDIFHVFMLGVVCFCW